MTQRPRHSEISAGPWIRPFAGILALLFCGATAQAEWDDPSYATLIVFYRFANTNNPTEDGSASGVNDGTLGSGSARPTWRAATNGISAHYAFDGGDSITVPSATGSLKGKKQATISLWYRPTYVTPAANSVLYYESTKNTTYSRFLVYQTTAGKACAVARDTNTGSAFIIESSGQITTSAWHHIAGTYSADDDRLVLYVDGVQRAAHTAAKGGFTVDAPVDPITVGKTGATYANGRIDDVRVYTNALSSNQVFTIWYETKDAYGYASTETGSVFEF